MVAALDAVFGGLRAYLEQIFDSKVFVVSFVFNVLVAALIVYVGDQLGVGSQLSTAIIVVLGIRIFGNAAAAAQVVRCVSDDRRHPEHRPPRPARTAARRTRLAGPDAPGRSQIVFGALAVLLCLLLGVAIVTQVRQNESGDSLESARPADLLVLLDSLQQREAALNTEVADLQRTLASLQASGSSDQAAIENAQARLAALSILIGTGAATGPGVTLTIRTPRPAYRPRPCST